MTPQRYERCFDDPSRRSDPAHSQFEASRRRCGWRRDGSCPSRVSRSRAQRRPRDRERRGDAAGELVWLSRADWRCGGGAPRWTRFAVARARQKLRGRRIRRGRFSHADGTQAAPAGPAARGRAAAGAATRRCRERARASTPDRDAISGLGRGHLGRPGALWAAHPVCASLTTARDLGYVDANRQPAGRVRASVSELHSRLGHDSVTPFTRCAVRDPDSRRWNFINGRSRSRSASPVR